MNIHLTIEYPPNRTPDAIPTQNPIIKPSFTLSQHEGACWYMPGTAGIFYEYNLYKNI